MMRQVLFYTDEDGIWCAEVPSLPGCFSSGKTQAEAIQNIQEAIELYIETLVENHQPIPDEAFTALVMAVPSSQ